MRIYLLITLIIGLNFNSYSQGKETKTEKVSFNPQVAIKFMNDYVNYCNSSKRNNQEWIKNNQLVTNSFKAAYKKALNGYFDPILNAQDYPDKGFKIMKMDSTSGYITLSGVDWNEFVVTVKVILQNNQWLVDGAGVINIPENKRGK